MRIDDYNVVKVIEMELMEAIRKRRTIRKYKDDPISENQIKYVLNAARLAPSWANEQSWKFIIVTKDDVKDRIVRCISPLSGMTLCPAPPILIIGCADPKKSGVKDDQEYYLLEMGIAMEHLMLAATEIGLGTAWICAFDEKAIKKMLGIPEDIRVVAITPLGHPAEKIEKVKDRETLEDITCNESWK